LDAPFIFRHAVQVFSMATPETGKGREMPDSWQDFRAKMKTFDFVLGRPDYRNLFCKTLTTMFVSSRKSGPGLPDFSWYNIPKREKYTYQMTTKYTNWPLK
jgi:hypothetical protein